MTKITVKELKAILATLADDEEISLYAYAENDETGSYGTASLETASTIILQSVE